MNATIEAVCYRSKVLANNESPMMLRVTKDKKRQYESLGFSLDPKFWDFEKNRPRRNCPNKSQIEQVISAKIKAYKDQIMEWNAENKEYTPSSLIDKVKNPVKARTVKDMFDSYIARLITENRTGYALSVKETRNSLEKFSHHLNFYFSDIDNVWLKQYESYLRGLNMSENTIGKRFRTLRMMFNLAIDEKIVKPEYYPFKNYKVSRLHKNTAKRAIIKDDVKRINEYELDKRDRYLQFAKDLFIFSYFMGGINFVDIAYLTQNNIVDSRLIYSRKKTGKLIKLPLQEEAKLIINHYQELDRQYLFPILTNFHKTEQQQRNRIHKVITKVNEKLKLIGKELGIPIDLTTYVARHTFATVLKRSGVNTSIICESLGHSSEKVTQIYLDSFENSQIDAAMQNLL